MKYNARKTVKKLLWLGIFIVLDLGLLSRIPYVPPGASFCFLTMAKDYLKHHNGWKI